VKYHNKTSFSNNVQLENEGQEGKAGPVQGVGISGRGEGKQRMKNKYG
jgi:hypothetical protein